MKSITKTLAFLLCLALIVGVVACTPQDTPSTSSSGTPSTSSTSTGTPAPDFPETIKVAVIGPITGNYTLYGTNMANATKLVFEQVNEAGGIKSMGGAKLVVDAYDDKNDAKESVSLANRVVSDKDYVACIGPFSTGNGLAIKPIFNEAGIPLISPSISNPDFAKEPGDYMFGGGPTQVQFQSFISNIIVNDLGYTKGILFAVNTENGQNVASTFDEYFTAAGGTLVHTEFYEAGTKDFKPQIVKMRDMDADFVYVTGAIAEGAPIVNQLRELQIDLPLLSQVSFVMQEYIDIVGENGEGQIAMAFFSPANDNPQKFEDFRTTFQETYGNSLEAHGFNTADIALMLVQVLEEMGELDTPPTTPTEIREAFRTMIPGHQNIHGFVNDYAYSDYGQIEKAFVMVELKDGKFIKWEK